MKEPKFKWDPSTGVATCILNDGKREYVGYAKCAEEDKDMASEKTGCQIALYRAEIEFYKHLRDNEVRPALLAFKHAYSCISQSSHFVSKSYEARMLRREIHRKEFDLELANLMLKDKKRLLKELIDGKEKFYQHIRSNRKNKVE